MSPPPAAPAPPERVMQQTESATNRGAVAALVIATAPGASPPARDLLWRSVLGRPLISYPLHELQFVDALGFCGLVAPLGHRSNGLELLHSIAPSDYNQFMTPPDNTWFKALAALCDTPIFSEWIIVIDATLPLMTASTVRAGLRAANQTGIAIAGEPVKETLKRVHRRDVIETPLRGNLRRLLSPAIFQREALQRVLDRYKASSSLPDDLVALAQLAGIPLTVFDADYPTVRITAEADLAIVEALLSQRESEAHPS
jgi:hypothetical protein